MADWSEKEIETLKNNLSKTDKEITNLIPKRTLCAVTHKRERLGFRKGRYFKDKLTCVECNVELTHKNWHESYRKTRHYICKECERKRQRKYYSENKEKYRKYQREYARQYLLNVKGKKIRVNKRIYQEKCELCNEEKSRIEYHHWNDEKPENGLWLCFNCHRLAEVIDKFGLEIAKKYLKLKRGVNNES